MANAETHAQALIEHYGRQSGEKCKSQSLVEGLSNATFKARGSCCSMSHSPAAPILGTEAV